MGNFFGPWWDKEVEKTKQWRKDKKKKAQERNNKPKKVVFDKKVNKIWNEIEKTDSKKTVKKTTKAKESKYVSERQGKGSPGKVYVSDSIVQSGILNMSPMERAIDNSIESKKASNIKKGSSVYTPTDTTLSPYGRSKLNRPSGQEVPGNRAVKDKAPVSDLMYGYANQGIKGKQVRSDKSTPNYQKAVQKDTKKKKKRALGRRTHKAAQGLLQRPTRKSQY